MLAPGAPLGTPDTFLFEGGTGQGLPTLSPDELNLDYDPNFVGPGMPLGATYGGYIEGKNKGPRLPRRTPPPNLTPRPPTVYDPNVMNTIPGIFGGGPTAPPPTTTTPPPTTPPPPRISPVESYMKRFGFAPRFGLPADWGKIGTGLPYGPAEIRKGFENPLFKDVAPKAIANFMKRFGG